MASRRLRKRHAALLPAGKRHPHRELLQRWRSYQSGLKGPHRSQRMFEDNTLDVSFALPFGLNAILAYRLLFATLDATFPTSYEQVNQAASQTNATNVTYSNIPSWSVSWGLLGPARSWAQGPSPRPTLLSRVHCLLIWGRVQWKQVLPEISSLSPSPP